MGDYEESGPSEDACGVEDGGVGRCRGGGGSGGEQRREEVQREKTHVGFVWRFPVWSWGCRALRPYGTVLTLSTIRSTQGTS